MRAPAQWRHRQRAIKEFDEDTFAYSVRRHRALTHYRERR